MATRPVELNLHELSAVQCRLQLQGLIFDLWGCLSSTRSELAGKECLATMPCTQPACTNVSTVPATYIVCTCEGECILSVDSQKQVAMKETQHEVGVCVCVCARMH